MKKKVKRKTVMAYFRRKSIAVFMAFLMVFPQIAAGFASPPVGDVSSVRQGAIKTGKVDMASGNLAFVENIFSLKGYKLTLKYNTEGIAKVVKKINDTHATGVVGLGWKLSKDRIVRLTHQTANTDDDDYMLNAHGKMIKLTFEYEARDTVHFRAHENPYWKIYYLERNEQWVVQKQNGNEYIYGDGELGNTLINHDANSTETSVTWNNWIGSSVVSNNQTPLIVAWNLSAIDNMYGERVKLFYEQERESVGGASNALQHTRAAYLTRVIGQNESSIQLEYRNKGLNEYADPHVENTNPTERNNGVTPPQGDNDRDAFQERFEKRYLSKITRRSPSTAIDRVVEFEYDIIGQNRQQKRILTEIKYKNNNGSLYQPSKKYSYYSEQDGLSVSETDEGTTVFRNGALYGALKSVTIPGGGTYIYKYDEKEIASSRLHFDIPFPANYTYTDSDNNSATVGWHAPQLFFMEDYVVVIHELSAYDLDRSNVGVATWTGQSWAYQNFGNFDGKFYDRYHTEDYHIKSFISTFKTSLMTSIGSNLPLVGGIMAAFNDDISGVITTYYEIGEDLARGDVGGAMREFFVGNFERIRDVVEDVFQALESTFQDLDLLVGDMFGINMHNFRQQDLARKAQEYNAANPRKKYHITMQKDFFALTSTTADQNGNDYNQNVHIFELDPLVEGHWHRSAIPVMLSSKYMGINSGEHFVSVFDEISDMMYTMTRHRYRKWKADVIRVPQALTEDEKLTAAEATANVGNDLSMMFGSESEDADFLNRLSSDKRSSVGARNNFIVVSTCQANGTHGRVVIYHHDKNKDWNWANSSFVEFDKTLIPTDIANSGMGPVSQGLAPNSVMDLKVGNSIAGLTVYDNLDTEAYSDMMSLTFGGLGVTDGSTDPINPLSTIQGDLLQDMTAMTATYGIVWNEDFSDIDVVLLHTGIGQTGMKTYVNGNVIHKVGRAYTPLIGSQSLDENGTNYAFRYDGEKFVTSKWQSDYFSSIMAPDVATQLVEDSDKTYKTPKFQQYFANREVTSTSSVVQQGSYTSSGEGDSYSAFELLNNVSSNDTWSEISNASQERIPAPEFVKEAVHLASDLINLVIQVIMMLIPFAQEFAVAAKTISAIDKIVQAASLAAMAIQPAADELVDKIMGVNHKSTSIANNYLSTNGKLFARQPNGNWSELGTAFPLGDNDKLIGINNGISNGYYNYTVKKANAFTDENGVSTNIGNYVTLLKNRKIYKTIPLNQRVNGDLLLVRKDSLVMTGGNNAFVAYGPANDDGYVRPNTSIIRAPKDNAEARRRKASYDDAKIIRLHRIADNQVTGRLKDYVVSSVETNTGFDSTYQHYVYNNDGATYHDAHGAAIYPRVDVVPSNVAEYTAGEHPFGYKSYYFFNSNNFYALSGNSQGYPASLDLPTEDPLVSLESFDHRDLQDFHSSILQPLQGRQYLVETYDAQNNRVSRKIDCHVIYAHDFFHRGSQLELDHVYQPLSSVSIMEVDGIATKTVNRYTNEYRATLLRTVEHHATSIDGTPEVHYQSKTYAFEHYPELLNENRLHEVSFVVDSVKKGNRTYVLDATTTTYRPWMINGNRMLDVENVYKANLATDILNPEVENYQSVAAAEVDNMDRDFADYEVLLAAFETEIGNYAVANKAGIAANQAAHDSRASLDETQNEVIESSHELIFVTADLSEANQEISDQKAEITRLKGVWDHQSELYQNSIDAVNKKYKYWQDLVLARNVTAPIIGAVVPLAGLILAGAQQGFIELAYKDYQKAVATRDSYKDSAETAKEDYQRAQDVLLSLQSEHESVVRSVGIANTSLGNSLDAFYSAVGATNEAVESSMEALQIISPNKRDKTKHAHKAAFNSQGYAINNHADFIGEVDHVERLLKHVVASASTYNNINTSTLVSTNEDTSTRPEGFFGYTPSQMRFLDKSVDLDGNGSPDMAYIDNGVMRIVYSDAPETTRTSKQFRAVDNDALLTGITSNDHFEFVKMEFANRYMLLRFNSQTSNMSLVNYERNFGDGRFINGVQFDNVVNWESQWNDASSQILAGDFDGNGVSDVIAFLSNSTKLMMNIISDPNHPVINLPATIINSDDFGQNRFVGDFNGDGLDDILASRYNGIEVYLSQVNDAGAVSFTRANVQADFDDNDPVPYSVARCFDVTGDGISDIVRFRVDSYARGTGEIKMSFADFEDETVRFTDFSSHFTDMNLNEPSQIVSVDFDGDGLNELFSATKSVEDDVTTMTLNTAEFSTRTVYQSLDNKIDEMITAFDIIRNRHDSHKTILGDLKDQHSRIIQKVRDLDVSAADIADFQGDIYSWFKTHSILSRDPNTGAAITTADSRGVKSSDLYDNEGRNIIASIVDADFTSNEALVSGFENYEDMSKFSVVNGASAVNVSDYTSLLQAVESHTGDRALLFNFGGQNIRISPSVFNPNPELAYADSSYIVSAFVKAPAEARVWVGCDTLAYADAPEFSKAKSTEQGWQYIEGVVKNAALTTDNTPSIHIENSTNVYIDDITVRPLAASFEYSVYDELNLPTAKMDANGLTKHMFYDGHHRLSTVIDDTGRIYGLNLAAFSREHSADDSFSRAEPNEASKFSFIEYGNMHRINVSERYRGFVNEDSDQLAVHLSVMPENVAQMNNLFNFRGARIQWNGNSNLLTISGTSGSELSIPTHTIPEDWTFASMSDQLYVWMNGKLMGNVAVNSAQQSQFEWSLRSARVANDAIILGKKPVFKLEFTNGIGQHLQTQRLLFAEDGRLNGTYVKGFLFDGWGHAAVSTLPMSVSTSDLSYKPNVIQSFDWGTGIMTGDVSSYYQSTNAVISKRPNDYKYPYFRTFYENSPLGRVVKKLKPGQEFYEVDNNATVVEYQDTESEELLRQFNLSPDKYKAKKTTNSLGHKQFEITDKMGRKVMSKKGSAVSQTIDDFNDTGYAKTTTHSPNHFAATDNSQNVNGTWFSSVHAQEDLLSFSDINQSPDRGRVELVKDQHAKLVYVKTASSAATENSVGEIKYYRYDEQERVIEQGIYNARWDKARLSTLSKSPFWYDSDVNWVKAYVYDIDQDGNSLYNKGRITQTHHNDGEFHVVSKFDYNIYGQITSNQLEIYNRDKDLVSNSTVSYEYYPSGQVKKITYPNGFELIYSFNRQGKIKSIGTPDDLDMFARYRYDQLDRLQYEYRDNGNYVASKKYDLRGRNKLTDWFQTESFDTIFSQKLDFFSGDKYYDTKISRLEYGGSMYTNIVNTYKYDDQGRLDSTITDMNVGTPLENRMISSYRYDANSNVTSFVDQTGERTNIDYRAGTNQDLVNGEVAYNDDGLKVRFESPVWGINSQIAYNRYTHKPQIFFKSSFPRINSGVWYKLSALSYTRGVLSAKVGKSTKVEVDDKLTYTDPEATDIQLFRFVPVDGSSGFHIKCRANEDLNLRYTAEKGFHFAPPATDDSDLFDCFDDGLDGAVRISSLGPDRVRMVVNGQTEQVESVSTSQFTSSNGQFYRLIPVMNAIPSNDFMLFSHDAKNNRVIKIRNFTDTQGSLKQDTLVYMHGNNRLPLSEYFSGVSVDGNGTRSKSKTISNYIYGPEFGSIGVRVYELDVNSGNPFGQPDLDETDSDSTDADGTTGSVQTGTDEAEPFANLIDKKDDSVVYSGDKKNDRVINKDEDKEISVAFSDDKKNDQKIYSKYKKKDRVIYLDNQKKWSNKL